MTEEEPKAGQPECCAKPENLETFPTTNRFAFIDRCKVCGRNHYRLKVQPVSLGCEVKR